MGPLWKCGRIEFTPEQLKRRDEQNCRTAVQMPIAGMAFTVSLEPRPEEPPPPRPRDLMLASAEWGFPDVDFNPLDTETIHTEEKRVKPLKTKDCSYWGVNTPSPSTTTRKLVFRVWDDAGFPSQRHAGFQARLDDGELVEETYFSIGGRICCQGRDRAPMKIRNDSKITPYPCHSARDIIANCKKAQFAGFRSWFFLNEQTWRSPAENPFPRPAYLAGNQAVYFPGSGVARGFFPEA